VKDHPYTAYNPLLEPFFTQELLKMTYFEHKLFQNDLRHQATLKKEDCSFIVAREMTTLWRISSF
jgi:hypothetical protein